MLTDRQSTRTQQSTLHCANIPGAQLPVCTYTQKDFSHTAYQQCRYHSHSKSIRDYMTFFRHSFPHINITPKQHMLEYHCIDFLPSFRLGLGLFGEQGGEETHAFVNELKVRVRGVNNPAEETRIMMKEHIVIVSPRLQSVTIDTKSKQSK